MCNVRSAWRLGQSQCLPPIYRISHSPLSFFGGSRVVHRDARTWRMQRTRTPSSSTTFGDQRCRRWKCIINIETNKEIKRRKQEQPPWKWERRIRRCISSSVNLLWICGYLRTGHQPSRKESNIASSVEMVFANFLFSEESITMHLTHVRSATDIIHFPEIRISENGPTSGGDLVSLHIA